MFVIIILFPQLINTDFIENASAKKKNEKKLFFDFDNKFQFSSADMIRAER